MELLPPTAVASFSLPPKAAFSQEGLYEGSGDFQESNDTEGNCRPADTLRVPGRQENMNGLCARLTHAATPPAESLARPDPEQKP